MHSQKAIKLYEEGRKLQQHAKLLAAERAYRKAIKIDPSFVQALNNLGNVLVDRDQLREATTTYRKALKLLPNHAMLLNNLGNALQLQGENDKAIEWFEKALTQNPAYADAYCNLGNALKGQNNLNKAIESYRKAIDIEPSNKEAYNGLANAFYIQGKTDDSFIAYNKVIEIDPNHKEAYRGLGNIFADNGDIDRAIGSYRKVLEIQPDDAEVYRMLSVNKNFTIDDEDLRAMERLINKKGISNNQKMNLAFALGKAYEDLGQYEQSMEMTILANRLKRKSIQFSITEEKLLFNEIRNNISGKYLSTHQTSGCQDATPIFILGMPRSGTSLAEQILASHPDVYGAGELPLLSNLIRNQSNPTAESKYREIVTMTSDGHRSLGEKYIEKIRNHSQDSKYITDKMPHNFMHIGFIKTILPKARIIHCNRNPMDNCLSLFKNNFVKGQLYSYDMTELGQYYKLYQDLMAHWRAVLPGSIYELHYEYLVADQEKETRKMLEYCQLPWDEACLSFHKTRRRVKTASNAQVRKPMYDGSIELWKRYENQLAPLHHSLYGAQ